MVVDLHLDEEIKSSLHHDPKYSLQIQIAYLEKELDTAILLGETDIIIIHGIGSGILKKTVHKILKNNPHVKNYINDYHYLYGYGSTQVTLY